jgi:hypothetical protein
MADNTAPAPNQAASWDELSTKFKSVGINEVTDYEGYLTACYKSKGELRIEEWDLVADHLKRTLTGQSTNTQSQGQKKAAKPQEASKPDEIGFWYGDVTTDGQKAQFADEDRRLSALKEMLRHQWVKQHPGEDPFSDKAREEYFGNVTFTKDNSDPIHAWTTTYISAESAHDKQAKELLKKVDAVGYARYEQNEKTRVYPDAAHDPAYIKAVLSAKEQTKKAYDQSIAAKKPLSREQVEVFFANEQLVSLYEFVKEYPEKARAYSKTYTLIRHAASLQRAPDKSDLYTVIRSETLTPSLQIHERRRQGAKFLYAKMAVLEDLAKKDPARAEQFMKEREKYGIMAERIMSAPEADVDKEISRVKTVLETNPLSLHDAAVLEKLAPPVSPSATASSSDKPPLINPYGAIGAIAGTTINLKKFLKPPPSSASEESEIENVDEEYDGDQEYEDGYQERVPAEEEDGNSDESEEGGGGERGGHGEGENGGGSDEEGGGSGNNQKRKKSLYEQQNNLRRRYRQLKRNKGLVNKGTNMVKNAAKNAGKKAVSAAEKQAAKLATQAASRIVLTPHFWIGVLILLVIILFIALIIYLFSGSDENIDEKLPEVVIVKSGPTSVANGEKIAYTLYVEYPGPADNIIVMDEIPDGTKLVEEETTQPFTYNALEKSITWSLKDIQYGGGSNYVTGSREFPQDKFQEYGFPPPEEDAISMPGELLAKWQSGMASHALRASQITGVDAGILGMWPWLEGTNYNNYYDNCNDPNSRPYLSDADYDGNTPCPYLNWQVSYGVRPMETLDYIKSALEDMHPGKTAQEVGQGVIDRSFETDVITYPGSTFPSLTIDEILAGIERGVGPDAGKDDRQRRPSDEDQEMRGWIAILLKDEAIGTYVLAKVFEGRIGPSLADIMEGWSAYYNRQKVINYIYAMYKAGIGGDGTMFTPETITLTLQPEQSDLYIINQASARVLGARAIGEEEADLPDPENVPPNDENCQGFYAFFYMPEGYQKNFGDPLCSLRITNDVGTVVVDQEKIAQKLKELDSENAEKWLTVIIPCISQFQANNWLADDTELGKWGLFGMGSTNPPFGTGDGPNGSYDRGDVMWGKQIENAVKYNNDLKERGQIWEYWPEECRPT